MKSTEAQTTLTTISITTTAATTKSFAPPKTTATKGIFYICLQREIRFI
jgi:hypothetical protein